MSQRILRKLIVLPFVLAAVTVDFNGCWRPVTAALSEVGIGVHTDDDGVYINLNEDHHGDDD